MFKTRHAVQETPAGRSQEDGSVVPKASKRLVAEVKQLRRGGTGNGAGRSSDDDGGREQSWVAQRDGGVSRQSFDQQSRWRDGQGGIGRPGAEKGQRRDMSPPPRPYHRRFRQIFVALPSQMLLRDKKTLTSPSSRAENRGFGSDCAALFSLLHNSLHMLT
ncbi:hypothetical protein BC567DRAFT_98616 [Phyllosticta citribraziliensis]